MIRLRSGQFRVKIEHSLSKNHPTEVIISRNVAQTADKEDRKRLSSKTKLQKTNRVVQGHAVVVRDYSAGKP